MITSAIIYYLFNWKSKSKSEFRIIGVNQDKFDHDYYEIEIYLNGNQIVDSTALLLTYFQLIINQNLNYKINKTIAKLQQIISTNKQTTELFISTLNPQKT